MDEISRRMLNSCLVIIAVLCLFVSLILILGAGLLATGLITGEL